VENIVDRLERTQTPCIACGGEIRNTFWSCATPMTCRKCVQDNTGYRVQRLMRRREKDEIVEQEGHDLSDATYP